MNVNFKGYGENVLTFIADSGLTASGVPVKISDEGTVARCGANDKFCGVCVNISNGYAAVQLAGYMVVSTAGKLSLGYTKVAVNSAGKVSANENGREVLVVNSTSGEAGIIL